MSAKLTEGTCSRWLRRSLQRLSEIVRESAGGGYEAWMAEKPLTDDMLRPYSKPEQEEMFGMLKGVKDVIGYVCSDKPTK